MSGDIIELQIKHDGQTYTHEIDTRDASLTLESLKEQLREKLSLETIKLTCLPRLPKEDESIICVSSLPWKTPTHKLLALGQRLQDVVEHRKREDEIMSRREERLEHEVFCVSLIKERANEWRQLCESQRAHAGKFRKNDNRHTWAMFLFHCLMGDYTNAEILYHITSHRMILDYHEFRAEVTDAWRNVASSGSVELMRYLYTRTKNAHSMLIDVGLDRAAHFNRPGIMRLFLEELTTKALFEKTMNEVDQRSSVTRYYAEFVGAPAPFAGELDDASSRSFLYHTYTCSLYLQKASVSNSFDVIEYIIGHLAGRALLDQGHLFRALYSLCKDGATGCISPIRKLLAVRHTRTWPDEFTLAVNRVTDGIQVNVQLNALLSVALIKRDQEDKRVMTAASSIPVHRLLMGALHHSNLEAFSYLCSAYPAALLRTDVDMSHLSGSPTIAKWIIDQRLWENDFSSEHEYKMFWTNLVCLYKRPHELSSQVVQHLMDTGLFCFDQVVKGCSPACLDFLQQLQHTREKNEEHASMLTYALAGRVDCINAVANGWNDSLLTGSSTYASTRSHYFFPIDIAQEIVREMCGTGGKRVDMFRKQGEKLGDVSPPGPPFPTQ